jgi:hypothetical protein
MKSAFLLQAAGLVLVSLCSSGCAVHYGHARAGVEHLWGLGRLSWRSELLTNGWRVVGGGIRVPGVLIGVGPDFIGVSLGYTVRERITVVPTLDGVRASAKINGGEQWPDSSAVWGLGHLNLNIPAETRLAAMSGRAAAGLGASFESGRPTLSVGVRSHQMTIVMEADCHARLEDASPGWPYFDLMRANVHAGTDPYLSQTASIP